MRALAILLLLTTAGQAAPLYLSCKGSVYVIKERPEPEPITISIVIDGTAVKVEDFAPAQIYSDDENVWAFAGSEPPNGPAYVSAGQINRITGRAQVMMNITESLREWFDGECRKTEKRF